MSAAPQLAPGTEAERPQAPAQEAPQESPLKKDFGEGGLEASEKALEAAGAEKLNELGKNLNLQAEASVEEFGNETKSWWERAKGMFKKKEGAAPAKGESEILKEIEKADAVYAEFKRKYDEVMSSGDEAALRGMENSLSKAYEQLAPQVAAEGADDAKAMRNALKTGEMPAMTEAGAKLNDVTRRLLEVRGRLNGAPAKAEAAVQPAVQSEPMPTAEQPQAEKELDEAIARGVSEHEAESAAAPAAKVETQADRDRSELEKASAGKPGEKMVADYLKVRDLKSDEYGSIAARAFDPIKGEIRLTYEDGSQLRKYASGLTLRVHPGGKVEEIKPPAAAEGTDENPVLLTPEMRVPSTEGVVSGEVEARPEPSPMAEEPSIVVSEEAVPAPSVIKTSEQSPVASGEIETEKTLPVEESQILSESPSNETKTDIEAAAEPPKSPRETYPNLPSPAPDSRPPGVPEAVPPEAPAENPEPAKEKEDSALDKLEARMDDAAAEIMKMPEAGESPKTFPTKVGKLSAEKFLEAFKAAGAITETEAKDAADLFKVDAEEFNSLRKKLTQAVRKRMKG